VSIGQRDIRQRAAILSEHSREIVAIATADSPKRSFVRLVSLARDLGYAGVAFGTVHMVTGVCQTDAFLVDPDTEPFVEAYMARGLGSGDPIAVCFGVQF
jgi:hypothetical protein